MIRESTIEPTLVVGDTDGDRSSHRQGAQRARKPLVAQDDRIDAVGKRAQLLDGLLRIATDRVELLGQIPVARALLRQPELDLNAHEPLLSSVMEILLDTPSLARAGLDDPRARAPAP
jgi:hypothetical protein